MEHVVINDKEVIVMNLVHYFITEQGYSPVIVHGINDEIWLENMKSDYKIIRIISRYIHNNDQLGFNKFRSNQILKKLKMKTFSFKMNMLSIYVNMGDNVTELDKDDGNNKSVEINKLEEIAKNKDIVAIFSDIAKKTQHKETGIELLFKITDDINNNNERKSKKMDKIFSSKKPVITYTIIAICVLMFFVSKGYLGDVYTLLKYGANNGLLVRAGEIYRVFTYMFLHGGIMHILLNMYSLFIVGPRVEDFFGKWKFILIYFLSGIGAGLLSSGLGQYTSVGASGAIFGLFGALVYFGYNYRGYIGTMIRSQIVPIVVYNLIIGFFIPGIDMWGHIGGLVTGFIVANMLGTIENKKYSMSNILYFVIFFAFLIYLGIFM